MRSGYFVSLVAAALFTLSVGGCAGVNQHGTGVDGGGGSSGGTFGNDGSRPEIGGIEVGNPSLCGNGTLDPGEQCDDGNTTAGDGCSRICQIPSGWSCSGTPSVCTMAGVCGDGILGATEICDDGNMTGGDGCAADCKSVDPGFECRVPGRPCVPACGDSMIKGMEQCDDGNTTDGDGCSSTCQVEPGAACPKSGTAPAPGACVPTICGNGKKEGNEGCDCGTNNAGPYPTGQGPGGKDCKGPNGLFFGDATGCSKTCTAEPNCRDANGKNQACEAKCGNGNVETGEQCDDGNTDNGDGCSSTCMTEGGFMCQPVMQPDTVPCTQAGNSGQCLELPIVYRDFKSEHETGGHPDFFYLGAPITGGPNITGVDGQTGAVAFNKRYCVPNSSGPAKKNDSTNRCWDMAQTNLAANGKPAFNMNRTGAGGNPTYCDCQFIDWSHDGNGNHVPGYTQATNGPTNGLTYTNGASGHPMYRGPAPVVSSASTFATWWTDSMYTNNTHTVGTLEMAQINGGTKYQYSSQVNAVTGGFFPLDPAPWTNYAVATGAPGTARMVTGTNEPFLCNLWPYWYSAAGFGAANTCRGDQYMFPPSLLNGDTVTFPCPAGMNCGGKWYTGVQGWFHDSWFSDEVRYLFTFNGAFSLQFYGDDDMFIFINGILVVDLGGVHQRLPGRVDVDATGVAMITEGGSLDQTGAMILACPSADQYTGSTMNATANNDGNGHSNCTETNCDCRNRPNVNLGLMMNKTYEIAVFGADRHPTESNYQLTLSGFQTNKTSCMPRCGDGTRTGAEECDCGDMTAATPTDPLCAGMHNDDTRYGGCTTKCQYGPYCGDGVVNGTEECDLGSRGNTMTYGNMNGCAPGCKFPHFCGDGNVDEAEGEQCDLGTNNGMAGQPCTSDCKIPIDI